MTSSEITKRTRAKVRVRPPRPTTSANAEIDRQIAALEKLDIGGLRWAWRERTGREAPDSIGSDLLIRALAYRLQARTFGDLDRRSRHVLDRVADNDLSVLVSDRSAGRNLKPGTVLVREYRGATHRVVVQEDGYGWNGLAFTTLSAVAKAITGSNWNGYVFFGLKAKPKASDG